MKRHICNVLALISLLICVASVYLWVRNCVAGGETWHVWFESVGSQHRASSSWDLEIISDSGGISVNASYQTFQFYWGQAAGFGYEHEIGTRESQFDWSIMLFELAFMQPTWHSYGTSWRVVHFSFSDWFLVLCTGMIVYLIWRQPIRKTIMRRQYHRGGDDLPIAPPVDQQPPTVHGILDYASPRSSSNFRLPSRSVISWETGPAHGGNAGDITITERLEGQTRAIAAMVFAGCVIIWLVVHIIMVPPVAFLFGPFIAGMMVVMFLVIRQTWRQTTLKTVEGDLHLTFSAALKSRQAYVWKPGDIVDIRMVATDDENGLGELQIVPKNSVAVRLFIDHRQPQLKELETVLRTSLLVTPMQASGDGECATIPRSN